MIDEASKAWLKEEIDMVNQSMDENLQDMIGDADPIVTGRKDIYAEALRLVSNCEDLPQIVSLVNWLVSLSYAHQAAWREASGVK